MIPMGYMSVLVRICLLLVVSYSSVSAQSVCGQHGSCECRTDGFCYDLQGTRVGTPLDFGIVSQVPVDNSGVRGGNIGESAGTRLQALDSSRRGGSSDTSVSIEELVGQGGDSLILKYDDMPMEYGGIRRSPTFFERERGANRFPSMSTFSMDAGMNPESRERNLVHNGSVVNFDGLSLNRPLDLSVDDEIHRASLAPIRNVDTLNSEFLNNEGMRDRHLDSFKTVRAIATLTLSYLDKTVAAGLATTRQEASLDGIQHLLKQVSTNISKMANPQRRRVYDELDEKFEACMTGEKEEVPGGLWVGSPEWAAKYPADAERLTFNPWVQCDVKTRKGPCVDLLNGSGRYHFCSCCADVKEFAVMSTGGAQAVWGENGVRNSEQGLTLYDEGYSTVDRVFLGRKVPNGLLREKRFLDEHGRIDTGTLTTYDAGYLIYDFSTLVRALYGDVVYLREGSRKDGAAPNPNKYIRRYVPPLLSVSQWVQALRDAEKVRSMHPFNIALTYRQSATSIQDRCWWENHGGAKERPLWLRYCPAMGSSLVFGVCPALERLMELEKGNLLESYVNGTATNVSVSYPSGYSPQSTAQYVNDLWTEASLGGGIFTVAKLRALVELDGTTEGSRLVQAYCDVSAVEGLKRLHRRVRIMAEGFLAANTKVPNEEKEVVKSLIQRMDNALELGTQDSRSQVDSLLLALDSSRDRRREAVRSALTQSTRAAENRSRQLGQILQPFGGALPSGR